jgi:hypothetical protein
MQEIIETVERYLNKEPVSEMENLSDNIIHITNGRRYKIPGVEEVFPRQTFVWEPRRVALKGRVKGIVLKVVNDEYRHCNDNEKDICNIAISLELLRRYGSDALRFLPWNPIEKSRQVYV